MNNYTVFFPDRVVKEQSAVTCSCMMVACDNRLVERGVRVTVIANTRQDAWARMKEKFPFERITVVSDASRT